MLPGPSHSAEVVPDAELDAGMHDCMLLVRARGYRTMSRRLIGLILGAGTGLLLGGQLVIAVDRIDLFDTNSNRAGYIIVDPRLNGSIRTTRNRIAPGGTRSLRSPGPSRSTTRTGAASEMENFQHQA